jgi:hypothetical protein
VNTEKEFSRQVIDASGYQQDSSRNLQQDRFLPI